jgi:hypothetical protein
MPMATQGLHQHRETGVVLYHPLQHHLVEVRAMVPTRALGDVHDLCGRRLSAVRAAIDMQTRRLEMAAPARQPQPRGRRGGHEAIECCHSTVVEGIEGAPEGVIMEMAGLHAWGNEARDGLMLENMGHEGEWLVTKTPTVEHHGFARMAGGDHPHGRVLRGGSIHDCGDAKCFKHARDQTQVIEDLWAGWLRRWRDGRAIRVSHSLLLYGGDCIGPPKLLNYTLVVRNAG